MSFSFSGAEPFFGTNPISFSFPSADSEPVIVDMATSNAAFGKILHARENNLEIPDNWAVDAEGNAITDPTKFAALLIGATGVGLLTSFTAIQGMVGTLFAANKKFISPDTFSFSESVLLFAIVILGGAGSIPGVILGAFLVIGLPELFRDFADARMLIFGGATLAANKPSA